jgi:hypothetical protein
MSKVAAFHTSSQEYPPKHREVYHDHDDCMRDRLTREGPLHGGAADVRVHGFC